MAVSVTQQAFHYRNIWLGCGLAYTLFIIAGSLLAVPDVSLAVDHSDKIIHFLLYFLLVGWFSQLYNSIVNRVVILIASILLGMLLEYLQGLTAYRSMDINDAVANSIGAFTAFSLSWTRIDSILSVIDGHLHQFLSPQR